MGKSRTAKLGFHAYDEEEARYRYFEPGSKVPSHVKVGDHVFADDLPEEEHLTPGDPDPGVTVNVEEILSGGVDDVLAALKDLDPNGPDYAAVIKAEREGQARKGILGE